ncbi:MlaD family protein [Roseococcus sp.]|uniref:MlaD family protein n=1 Tax=Roseococcus sp. TaxID=2109646 RepID=UPI003BA92E58
MASARRIQFSVGLMVLVGLGLLLTFVFFLTQSRLTGSSTVLETYLRESVQGLEVGSPVRYRGVSVGRVTAIGLASAEYRRPEGVPFANAFQLVVVRFAVDLQRVGDIPAAEDAVKLGLRARLTSQGITGVSYIELDFVDPDQFAPSTVPWTPAYTWIPSVPSTVAQVQTAAETVMRQLQGIDFATLFSNISTLVVELRDEAKALELAQAVGEATALLRDFRRIASDADIPGVVSELRATSAALRGTVDSPDVRNALSSLAAAAQDLRRTAARLPGTVTQLEAGVRGVRGTTGDLQADLAPLLRDLRATTANLRETTEALRRSPSQALLGAPPPTGAGR